MAEKRYTICIDFDGVIHSYTSPWSGPWNIPDPPVPGALAYLRGMSTDFDIAIFSTRNHQWNGTRAMKKWLIEHFTLFFVRGGSGEEFDVAGARTLAESYVKKFKFPWFKPAALLYIDDRAYRFEGNNWPSAEDIYKLKPWNKVNK